MSGPSGLTQIEVALLRSIAGSATEDGPVRTSHLLASLDRAGIIGPRAAPQVLVDLVAPWRRHLPLVVGHGNWGSQGGDPAADPDYTEVGLTPFGALALQAEDGTVGPVPLGLIDGTWYRGGQQPPYAPAVVLEALRRRDATALVPSPPTGGTVDGDLVALAAGRPVELILSGSVVLEHVPPDPPSPPPDPRPGVEGGWFAYSDWKPPGGDRLVVTAVPYGVTVDEVVQQLAGRLKTGTRPDPMPRRYAPERSTAVRPAPIVDLWDDTSAGHGVRVVARLGPGADPDEARSWVLATHPLTTTVDALLPAPMDDLIRTYDLGDGSGLDALAQLLG